MKVALVQDWLVVNGGAEKVFKEIAALYPDADVFALIDFLSDEDRQELIRGRKVTTSFLQNIPNSRNVYRSLLPLFPLAITSLDFSKYDLIISSSYSVAKGLKSRPDQIHICYCHSPVRYAWDLKEEYLASMKGLKRYLAELVLFYIRKWDLKTANRPSIYIANSKYIAERIKRIYNRDAFVLYPPVQLNNFVACNHKEDYYFTSARLVAYKKTDLIVEAFNELPHLKLIVSGDGPQLDYLKSIAKSNIIFTGYLDQPNLIKYIQKAKAFILAANEDFGITSIEAQSCHTPVIALKKGGYLETVLEEETGVFFEEQSATSLRNAVEKFENLHAVWKDSSFDNHVKKFSLENFKKGFGKIAQSYA